MATPVEVKVPDIGDFKDVAIIELLVKPGEVIAVDTALIVVESDKASMEIPSSQAGTVKELKVKLGDKVSEGSVILLVEAAGASAAAPANGAAPASGASATSGAAAAAPSPSPARSPAPSAATFAGKADLECEMLVLGAGPGGYSAAFRSADVGMKTVLVERYATLGGVCLNVGCIPSKALLHTASVMDEVKSLGRHGIKYAAPEVDVDSLRAFKDGVVKKLTGGLAGMAKARKVEIVTGVGSFLDPNHLEVAGADGTRKVVKFAKAIIAAGSQAVKLPGFPWDDPRMMDSTDALLLQDVPKKLLVVGGGIIGLEMACVYEALGAQVTVVELLDQLMPGADPDLVKPLATRLSKRYAGIHLKVKVAKIESTKEGLKATFEGEKAPEPQVYDRVLVAIGRSPNGNKIDADKAGVQVTDRGFIPVDKQMRTNVPHIFAIGDLVGQPMLAHKATHEGKVAAEVCAGQKSEFVARVIPSVAYTDPEVAWVGVTEGEAKAKGIKYGIGKFPWAASGRAIGIARTEGFTKLIFDETTHKIIGAGIVGVNAGDLICELGLAIEMGCEAADIGLTVHPHPTLGESIGMAAEVYEGTITDLYIPKKK